ncbi:MAG TPA: DUF3365 domain-containing protein [Thiobacillaceae bacterium]|nr:DUF3365 domain-containing protein [Thiobacillaceae bacterium]
MIRTTAIAALAAGLFPIFAWSADPPPLDDVKAVAGGYANELRAGLMAQMRANGPEGGIQACSALAAQLGATTAARTGWSIRRVSTRPRNPLAMPDAYEHETLKAFAREIASGKADASRYEVVEEAGVSYARFMKAIRIEPQCLTCHGGTEVAPDVARKLAATYPHDAARGYKVGDLRGALSIRIRLDDQLPKKGDE